MTTNRPKVVVIGLDGVTFDVIMPLIEKGAMPTMKQILEKSSWGEAKSCFPPLTCPAWFVISTGKNPGKLGSFNFFMLEKNSYRIKRFDNSEMKNERELWDILNDYGLTTAIFNNPVAFPPKPVDGYMVAGFLTPSTLTQYTYPADLKKELDKLVSGYEIDADQGEKYSDQHVIESVHRVLSKRTRAITYLVENKPADFMLLTWTGTDRICHQLLNYTADPEKKDWALDEIERFFSALDKDMGKVLSLFSKEDYIFVISDHGFQIRDQGFYINQWLIDEGYLVLKEKKSFYEKFGITQKGLGHFLDKFGLKNFVRGMAPKFLTEHVPVGAIEGEGRSVMDLIKAGLIDWNQTRALAIPGGIYFNTVDRPEGIVPIEEKNNLRQEIIRKMEKITNPFTGNPLQIKIIDPQKEYSGHRIDEAPDIQCILENYRMEFIRTIPEDGKLFGKLKIAHHNDHAIFAASGPGIKEGQQLTNLSIMDLFPTVLSIYGISVPDEVDGRVPEGVFDKQPPFIKPPLERAKRRQSQAEEHEYSEEEARSIEEKMKNLGYLE